MPKGLLFWLLSVWSRRSGTLQTIRTQHPAIPPTGGTRSTASVVPNKQKTTDPGSCRRIGFCTRCASQWGTGATRVDRSTYRRTGLGRISPQPILLNPVNPVRTVGLLAESKSPERALHKTAMHAQRIKCGEKSCGGCLSIVSSPLSIWGRFVAITSSDDLPSGRVLRKQDALCFRRARRNHVAW